MKKSKLYIFLLLVFCVLTSSEFKSGIVVQKKISLLYVYDPLCGWCYGFGPVMEQIAKNYNENVDIEIISGGMVIGERIKPVGNMSAYILESIPRLERTSGVTFGQPYIELIKEGSYITSSEKPSIALCVYKSFKIVDQIAFAHAIQKSYFLEAKDLNQDSTYSNIASRFGIDKNAFLKRMQDSTYLNLAHAEFNRASVLGVNGFPTVLEKNENGYKVITEGYTDYSTLEKYLNKAIKQKNVK
jgi:putative protein-disulfide isomerase